MCQIETNLQGLSNRTRGRTPSRQLAVMAMFMCCLSWQASAADTTPREQLNQWSAKAGAPGDPEKGRVFFNSKHGSNWSCASCHQSPPTIAGKHASTSKPIKPLAPAFNADAFTETAKVNKWFKRNCQDVLKRECSASEKADVLAYLLSLKNH